MRSSINVPVLPSSMGGCHVQMAFACCVVEWLNRNAVRSPPGRCLACGDHEHGHDALLPYGVEPTGYAWLHSRCWEVWHNTRKREAVCSTHSNGNWDTDRNRRSTLWGMAEQPKKSLGIRAHPDDGVEGRAQLMAHIGEELRLVLARLRKLATFLFDLEENAGAAYYHCGRCLLSPTSNGTFPSENRWLRMSDPYFEAAQEQWPNIRALYMMYSNKKPIILYDIQEKKIYAYPYKEFKAELSRNSQASLKHDYICMRSWERGCFCQR